MIADTNTNQIFLLFAYILVISVPGGHSAMADAPAKNATQILFELQQTDPIAYCKAGDLQMLLVELVDPATLADLRGEDDENRVMELANWPNGPVQVVAAREGADFRIRSEGIRIVIHCRQKTPLAMDAAIRDVIREATRSILAARYRLGPDKSIASRRGSRTNRSCMMISENAILLDGKKAVVCFYSGMNDWGGHSSPLIASIRVLATAKDVIVVAEKFVARGIRFPWQPQYYAGLIASQTRLTDVEAEKYADQSILAKETVFGGKTDLSLVPRELVNGCMWPIDDDAAVGLKDLCSATILRPPAKAVSTPDAPPAKNRGP
jgi:hypothetical protein